VPQGPDQKAEEVSGLAQVPARRSARTITLADPSRELEDIDECVGQLMSMAFGDMAFRSEAAKPRHVEITG